MAQVKISALPAASSVSTTDEFEANQSGTSRRATAAQILTGALAQAKAHFINDTANANMTTGLTLNQGAATDEIVTLKQNGVDHGITTRTETDSYGVIKTLLGSSGALLIWGFSETTRALALAGTHTTDDTTKTTSGLGAIMIDASLKSGTTSGSCGADANLVVIRNASTARFIFDAEGSAHADVEWIAFDDHDDLALLNGLDHEFMRRRGDPIKAEFSKVLAENRRTLQREKIVNFYDKSGRRAMVNFTRLAMLHTGAIRQLGRAHGSVKARLQRLEKRLEKR